MNVNADITKWDDEQRRISSIGVFGASLAVALAAVAVWWFVDATPAWVYWILVGLLALVLAFMVLLMVLKPRAAMAPPESAMQAEAAPEMAPPAPAPAFEPRVLTLRCGDCGTIFEVTDTGERPLYHTCPGCGAEGALRDPVEAPAAPEAEAAPAPEATYAPPAAVEPVAEAAPAPAPVKRIKLRCGGCKEVFAIEDSGERPLKRACPSCGRMGMIR